MTSPLLLLAEKVEGLEGPDREVDEKIGMAIGLKQTMRVGHELLGTDRIVPVRCPHYTASVDSAMSLVPEGFMWRLQSWPDGVNSALLEKDAGDFGAIDARHTDSFATTPALALVATSLRARAAMEAGE